MYIVSTLDLNERHRLKVCRDETMGHPWNDMDMASTISDWYGGRTLPKGYKAEQYPGFEAVSQAESTGRIRVAWISERVYEGYMVVGKVSGLTYAAVTISREEYRERCNSGIALDDPVILEKMQQTVDAEASLLCQYLNGKVYGVILEEKCPTCNVWSDTDQTLWGVYDNDEAYWREIGHDLLACHVPRTESVCEKGA